MEHRRSRERHVLVRRWLWCVAMVLVSTAAVGMLVHLHGREREQLDRASDARVFAARARQAIEDGVAPPASATGSQLDDITRLDPPRGARVRRLLGDVPAQSQAGLAAPAAIRGTAAQVQALIEAVARNQQRRADAVARNALIGTIVVALLAIALAIRLTVRVGRVEMRERARSLKDLSEHDPLTGLANRRRLELDLAALTHEATAARPVEIAICDLDGFKAINDLQGHDAGDALLVAVARSLQEATAGTGSVYRLGGDEFCLVSKPGTQIAVAAATGFPPGASGSVGAALWPTDAPLPADVMHLADERMYTNKRARKAGLTA
jgi:GGDEF domain-containing protein